MKSRNYKQCLRTLFNNMTIKSKIFIFYAGILLISVSIFALSTIKISNQAIVSKATKNACRELALINKSLMNLTNNSENYVRILSLDNRLQNLLARIKDKKMDPINILEVEKTLSTVISNIVHPITNIASASIISSEGMLFDIGYVDNSSIASIFDDKLIETITKKRLQFG